MLLLGIRDIISANATGCTVIPWLQYLICIQYKLDLNLDLGAKASPQKGKRAEEDSWERATFLAVPAPAFISTEAQLTRRPLPTAFITLTQRWAFSGHNQVLSKLKSHGFWVNVACLFPFHSEHEGKTRLLVDKWIKSRGWKGRLQTKENLYSKSV